MAGGLIIQVFWPRHSLQHGISLGLVLAGSVLWPSGKYLYIPVLLFVFAVLLGLGRNGLQSPSLILLVLAAIIGLYGWWENKKSKRSA